MENEQDRSVLLTIDRTSCAPNDRQVLYTRCIKILHDSSKHGTRLNAMKEGKSSVLIKFPADLLEIYFNGKSLSGERCTIIQSMIRIFINDSSSDQ